MVRLNKKNIEEKLITIKVRTGVLTDVWWHRRACGARPDELAGRRGTGVVSLHRRRPAFINRFFNKFH